MVKKISSCQLRHGNIYMIKSHILFIDMEGTGLGTGLHLWTINLCWCIWNRELFVLETIWPWEVPSAGSVDNKFAICAAEASKPSQSSGPSSESSPTSNPNEDWRSSVRDFNQYQNIKKKTILIKYSSIALTRKDQSILHAVHGNPPSIATGRVGAVGQIHFICNVNRFIR